MDEGVERDRLNRTALEIAELLPAVAASLRIGALVDATVSDLTANQLVTLILVGTAEGSRMRAGGIALQLSISPASATAVVDRLVEAGMLTRSRGDDRRIVWVSVTKAGEERLRRLKTGTVSRVAVALASITPELREQLVHSLRQVATFAHHFNDASAGTS